MSERNSAAILELLDGCMQGNRRSQELLYQQFYGYAMGLCLRYARSREEAKEILNDGFFKIFTKLETFDRSRPFKTWLGRVMINTALDQYRREAKHQVFDDIRAAETIAAYDDDAIGQMAYEELLAIIQRLPPAYRMVFSLAVLDGYTHEDIAKELEISVGASKSNLSRAREKLRTMLEKKTRQNMKEWYDEELDKLFRESSEKFDPTYEPGDWIALKRRLDVAEAGEGGWLKKATPWLAVLLLILVGGIGAYLTVGNNTGEKVPPVIGTLPAGQSAVTQTEINAKDESRARASTSPSVDGSLIPKKAEPLVAVQSERERIHEITNEKGPKELSRRLASVSGVRDQTDLPRRESGNGAILSNKNKKKSLEESKALVAEYSANEVTDASTLNQPTLLERNEWPDLNLVSHRAAHIAPTALVYPKVAYEIPSDYLATAPVPAPIDIPKWSVRIGVSPDLSMIKGSDMMTSANLGPAGSMLVERSISRRLSIQTGIIRSLKNYSAEGTEYSFPESWAAKQAKAPTSVDGSSSVFEIPLNVRLDFNQSTRSRWFGSAGVSSYKMQREKDTYHYDTYVPNAMTGWDGETGWYLLSHANISVGYERFVARRLSIVAEPYARVPLRGVGMGKVNLVSMGVWFSVRYTPVFRK